MKLKELKNKKILIVGLGKEGTDALKFFKKLYPKQSVAVTDEKMSNKKNYLKDIKKYDVIVKSPGIPLHSIKPLVNRKTIITSPSDIFLNNCQGLIIGVTGTKGKSTTCSLIHRILRKNKFKAELIGNIGKPVLGHLFKNDPDKIYVYELSSFQLATVSKSPQISIMLNLFKDHLDHHKDFQEYANAKKRIFQFQTKNDFLLYNNKDTKIKNLIKQAQSIKIPFSPINDNQQLFEIIGQLLQIPQKSIESEFEKKLILPHRLEFVGKHKKISFYNDSAATIPEATIRAIEKLSPNIDTIIVGGVNKGFDSQNLIKKIEQSGIKKLIHFPETGTVIAKKISSKIKTFPAENMKQAVSIAYQQTKENKICLLSPGASSFNMFKNYKQRGDLYRRYVKNEKN
jgi:UDP-N-acetylmuramoyl-L-alanine---L-glutamate ligase